MAGSGTPGHSVPTAAAVLRRVPYQESTSSDKQLLILIERYSLTGDPESDFNDGMYEVA